MSHGTGWAAELERTPFAVWIRQALWAYPAVAFDLRLLGLSPHVPVRQLAVHLLPWAWRGFVLVVGTGIPMFVAHASQWWENPLFPVKMSLVAAGGLNVWAFHRGVCTGPWTPGTWAGRPWRPAWRGRYLWWCGWPR